MTVLKNTNVFQGIFIAIIITVLPFTLFTHLLFDSVDDTINIFGLVINHGFQGTDTFIYVILTTLIPVVFLSIWYLECKNRWNNFILLLFFPWIDNTLRYKYTDKENFKMLLTSIIICILYTIILFLIKKKIIKKINLTPIFLNKLFKINNNFITGLKDKLSSINKNDKNSITTLVYYNRLLSDKLGVELKIKSKFQLRDLIFTFLLFISFTSLYWDYIIFKFPILINEINLFNNLYNFSSPLTFTYFFQLKFAILLPLLVWFFTSPYWWRFALISPILLNLFQIWEGLHNVNIADTISFYYAFPWLILILATLLLLDKKVGYASTIIEIKKEIDRDIEEILADNFQGNNNLNSIKETFENVKGGASGDNLKQLIELREELLKSLK